MGDGMAALTTLARRVADRAQFAAMRALIAALGGMSWRRATALGARLGALGYRPLGIRRQVVERQIAAAFPELDESGVRRIALGAYENLGRTSIETALLPSLGRDAVLDLFEGAEGWEHLEAALALGKGAILVGGHHGNWEIAGAYMAARGVPVGAIVRKMANPLFDEYLTTTRARLGVRVLHDAVAVKFLPRAFRDGYAIAFMSDQGVKGLASTYVDFFGRPARTPRGVGVLALRLGVPVIFGAALRQPSGKFRLHLERIEVHESGDRERDVDAVVAEFSARLEHWVRRAPEQYFWHHRRWRRQPPDTPPALRDPVEVPTGGRAR